MFNSWAATFSHTLSYIIENFMCVFYGLEMLVHKYLINFACYDLIVDISESFGVWTVIFILLTSSLLLGILIHSYTTTLKKSSSLSTKLNKQAVYISFIRFSTLTKKDL